MQLSGNRRQTNIASKLSRRDVLGASVKSVIEQLEQRQLLAAFTTGNIVVLQSDPTGATTTTAATAVSIEEFSKSGTGQTAFNSVALPTVVTTSPNQAALTQSGSGSTEGFLSRTQDGNYLLVAGYNSAVGTAAVSGTLADRVIGRISGSGAVDTSTRVPVTSSDTFRSAASKDGSTIYFATSARVATVAYGTQTGTTSILSLNSRQVGVFGDSLFFTSASGSNIGGNLLGTAGTLPTGTSTATLVAPTFTTGTANALGMYALDRDAGVPGIDQIFIVDGNSNSIGIRKFSYNGTTWTAQSIISGSFFSVAIEANGTGTDIYATTGNGTAVGNTLVKYSDSAAYNATGVFSAATILATAPTGTAFRGVTFSPNGATVTPPVAPSGLSATAASFNQIDLTWTDNSTDETGFVLDRSTSSDFTTGVITITGIPSSTPNTTTGTYNYSDTGLSSSTLYYYRVRSTISGTDSLTSSNVASATTLSGTPSAPTGLAVVPPASSTQINLTWNDTSSDETSFVVEYTVISNGTTVFNTPTIVSAPAQAGTGTVNYSVTGLEPGMKYFFRVKSTNAFGDSAYSNIVGGTTTAAAATSISFNGTATYTQNFDHLTAVNTDNTGVGILVGSNPGALATGTTGPLDVVSSTFFSDKNADLNGWSFERVSGSSTTPDGGLTARFAATTPALASGATYSFGADGNPERSLGMLLSGSNRPRIGATFVNTSGSTINDVSLAFIAETWRFAANLSESATFQYLVGGTSINDAGFTDLTVNAVPALNLTTSGAASGVATDGNNPSFQTAKSADLENIGWGAGQTLVIRWTDTDDAGADAGMGIDNFSLKITPADAGIFNVASTTVRARESGTATITVLRSAGSSGAADVQYSIGNLGTTSAADYGTLSGVLSFADGEASKDIVIPLSSDTLDETVEKFTITLTGVTGTTAPNGAIGGSTTATVAIVDNNGFALSGAPFQENWDAPATDTVLNGTDVWDNYKNITGYNSNAALVAGNASILADQGNNPGIVSTGGVAEFDLLIDPTVALQGAAAAPQPQLVIDLNTQGVTTTRVEFDARDIDGSTDNSIQPIAVWYRVGNSGAFTMLPNTGTDDFSDVTTGPSLATKVSHFIADLPTEVMGEPLVQIQIVTIDAQSTPNSTANDEWVGIDNINIGPVSGLPAWLDPASQATWSGGTLTVTGPSTIIADPGLDMPNIVGTTAAAQLLIDPANDAFVANAVHVGTITLSGGADITLESRPLTPARDTIVLLSTGVSITGTGSTLELNNNDLVVKYGANPTPYTNILNLVKSGLPLLGFGGDGSGIASANVQSQTPAGTMLGVIDGGTSGGLVATLSGVTLTNPSQSIVVKYTWRGDANLDGVVNGSDYALADTGFSGGGFGWFYGDMNYDNVINGSDYALIDTGFSSQNGVL